MAHEDRGERREHEVPRARGAGERSGQRDAREHGLALARAKRSAWLLAAVVVVIYVGYFVWNWLDGR